MYRCMRLSGLPAEKAGKEALFLRCRGRLRLFCLGGGRRGASGRHLGLDGNLRVFLLGLIVDGDFERCFFQGSGIRLDAACFPLSRFRRGSVLASLSLAVSASGFDGSFAFAPLALFDFLSGHEIFLGVFCHTAMAEESVGAVAGVPPTAASMNRGDVRPVARARSAAI